jgi:hypothetical protein
MPKRQPREARTLLEVCVARAGLRKGALIAEYIIEWTLCTADVGHEPSANEVAQWWKASERTAWRRLAAFKAAFPEFDNPAPLARQLIAEAAKRRIGEGLNRTELARGLVTA